MAEYVTVYCNLPMGLRLRAHDWRDQDELGIGGTLRTVKEAFPTGDEVVLHGTSAPFGQARKDADGNFVVMINGYAATPNVDKEFWDKWLLDNKDHPILRAEPPGLFARGKGADAQARDYRGARSGLEPLTPTLQNGAGMVTQSDPRAPRAIVRHEGERA